MTGAELQILGAVLSLSWGIAQLARDEVDRSLASARCRCQRCDSPCGLRTGITGRWATRLVCRRCRRDLAQDLRDGTLRLATPEEGARAALLAPEEIEEDRQALGRIIQAAGESAREVSEFWEGMGARFGSHDLGRPG